MNRYLVFAGNVYYASGGWADFVGSYVERTDALRAAGHALSHDEDGDQVGGKRWFQVVDSITGEVIAKGNGGRGQG